MPENKLRSAANLAKMRAIGLSASPEKYLDTLIDRWRYLCAKLDARDYSEKAKSFLLAERNALAWHILRTAETHPHLFDG